MRGLIRHAMCALMPPAADLPGLAETDVDGFLRRLQRESDGVFWLGVCVGAWLFVALPVLTLGLPLPSVWLSPRLLDRHAQRIATTRFYLLRQAVFVLRLCAGMCWGADPTVRARFALPPYGPDPGSHRT